MNVFLQRNLGEYVAVSCFITSMNELNSLKMFVSGNNEG